MAFSHSVYLVSDFQFVSFALVISVCQNVITSEYQNFVVLKFLIVVLEFSTGNFCGNNFFFQYFIADIR